jgi:phosphoribosylaminoimidazolecarboxamide formyltransferase/IMP cyclohydrolase
MRAILSVSNKTGVTDFARGLREIDVALYSTGGTKKAIAEAGVEVSSISELTGFPEILDGRVKTLHPAVHGGILARRDVPDHMAALEKTGIATIDLVVVNLYPFLATVTRSGVTLEEAIENIDIGGPTMIRSAAKNCDSVIIVVDPEDYGWVLQQLKDGQLGAESRRKLAQKAFQHTASYDTAIAQYLSEETFPEHMSIALEKAYGLRYGENPRQQACFYTAVDVKARDKGLGSLVPLSGPEVSFNNLLDFDSALATLAAFSRPTVAVLKHTNPCGLATSVRRRGGKQQTNRHGDGRRDKQDALRRRNRARFLDRDHGPALPEEELAARQGSISRGGGRTAGVPARTRWLSRPEP